eukprot:6186168-Pleurochrysis_carterae.AAC.3
MPIRNKKLLFLVKCVYFAVPLAAGLAIMQVVIPDPDSMRGQFRELTPDEQAIVDRQRRELQAALDESKAKLEAARQKQLEARR